MALPTLGLNIEHLTNNPPHPIDADKRRIPPDAYSVPAKRQFVGNSYDEIVTLAIKSFGPQMYLCQSTEPRSFQYEFMGKNRIHGKGKMTLLFTMQLDPTTMRTERAYNLTFRIADEFGELDASRYLFEQTVSNVHKVPCEFTTEKIREEIKRAIYKWLDFASLYYIDQPSVYR